MNITFEEAVESYLKFIFLKKKINTFKTIERRIRKYILPYFKGKCINEVSNNNYLEWQIYLNNYTLKYNYKSSIHYTFSDFLNYCMTFYDLKNNVAKNIGNFRHDEINDIGNIWTIEEFNKFIKNVDNCTYKVLFSLLYFTGVRKGEALALTWEDIDFDTKTISINKTITRFNSNNKKIINTPKSKSSIRKICIDNKLCDEIFELKEYYKNKYSNFNENFFIFGGSKSITFTTLVRKKDYYCDIANVKRIKIHEFRHSHACLLFKNNVPIDEISHRLGHSSISMTTDIYLRFIPKDEKRVISTLNSLRLS